MFYIIVIKIHMHEISWNPHFLKRVRGRKDFHHQYQDKKNQASHCKTN